MAQQTTIADKAKLCLLIKVHRCLYDQLHADFKKNSIKKYIWRKIASKMGTTDSECKKCWNNIRTAFISSIKKCKDNCDTSPYYMAEHLAFLEPFVSKVTSITIEEEEETAAEEAVQSHCNATLTTKKQANASVLNNMAQSTNSIKIYFNILTKRKHLSSNESNNNNSKVAKLSLTSTSTSTPTPTPTATDGMTAEANASCSIVSTSQSEDREFLEHVSYEMGKMKDRQKTEFKAEVYKYLDAQNKSS